MTMIDLFEKTVNEVRDEEALFVDAKDKLIGMTWGDYHKYVINFAKAIINLGIEPYKTINILGHNSPEWFISFLGNIYILI